ncbi:unnamed protein product, partial [Polarella glacialis]
LSLHTNQHSFCCFVVVVVVVAVVVVVVVVVLVLVVFLILFFFAMATSSDAAAEEQEDQGDQGEQCTICLEVVSAEAEAMHCMGTGAGRHRFHGLCLRGWVLRGQLTCPNCRGPVEVHSERLASQMADESGVALVQEFTTHCLCVVCCLFIVCCFLGCFLTINNEENTVYFTGCF